MSIVTMKKKTAVKYNSMSVNTPAFSINGTHRNQGFVGQNVISRSLPRTTVKSHGGCCGTFLFRPVVMSSVTTTEDPTVVKSSVLGTRGMIETKYALPYYKRPFPCSIVKPDATMNINNQSSYVANLAKNTMKDAKNCANPYLPIAQNFFDMAKNTNSGVYTIEVKYNNIIILTGVFTVNSTNNKVTHFYDLVNPHNDIFANNNYDSADNVFTGPYFSYGGVNITTLPYFEKLLGVQHFFFSLFDAGTNNAIDVVSPDDTYILQRYNCVFNITRYTSMMYNDYNNFISNYYNHHPVTDDLTTHKGCGSVGIQSCHKQLYRSISAPGRLPKPLQYTKDSGTYTSVSQSQYVLSLDKKCSENDTFTIPVDGVYGKKTSFNYPAGCH